MIDEVQKIKVDPGLAEDVRQAIASYARLRFTETRSLFGFSVTFTVTGPRATLDSLAAEVDEIKHEAWLDRQW